MPPDSAVTGTSAVMMASDQKTVHDRLLHHANEVRKHGNLDPLDAFLKHSGYSWIEMMISHAKDSHESYVSSTHDVDGTLAHAFEHRMAAELLKTPSPKKKRVNPAFTPFTADPFADDDKENAAYVSPLKARAAATAKAPVAIEQQDKLVKKSTRSKTDKSQLVQLPNPFEKRALQASDSFNKHKPASEKVTTSKVVKPLLSNPVAVEKPVVAAKPMSPKRDITDDDSREVECSLLAVGDVSKPYVRAKEVGKILGHTADATFPINEENEDDAPSPRESTPPPLSPTKNQRAEASMWARQKLDESLLRIDSDDENEEQAEAQTTIANDRTEVAQTSPVKESTVKECEESASAKETDSSSVESSRTNAISAPKRTLSSMAHAKKSLAGNGGKQQARSSSLAPSSSSVVKGSFLSKSIMRAELDQATADDTLDSLPSDTEKEATPTVAPSQLAGKKRKSEEEQVARLAKSSKEEIKKDHADDKVALQEQRVAQDEKTKNSTQPQQSLREKIESYAAPKAATTVPSTTSASTSASSGLSSMTAHQVGVGAAKIASPMFSRSNSSNTLQAEPESPTVEKKKSGSTKADKEAPKKVIQESESGDLGGKISTKTTAAPVTTTPLNSPGPHAYSLYPKLTAGTKRAVPTPLSSKQSKQEKKSPEHKRISHISIDDASESDLAAYDTSSDGDLSLVDLMGAPQAAASQASAPRPPGTTTRITPALPKAKAADKPAEKPPTQASAKITTSSALSAIKDINRSPSRLGTASSTTSTSSGSSASSVNNATWGGSISSKLKGILGFSSSTSGPSPSPAHTNGKPSSNTMSKQQPASVPARKDSFVAGGGNAGARTAAGASASASKASNIIKQKEAEAKMRQIEERARIQAQANAEATRKRLREEAAAAVKNVAAAKMASQKSAQLKSQQQQQSIVGPDAKKRKSNEGVAVSATQHKASATASSSSKNGTAGLAGSFSSVKASINNGKSTAQTMPKTYAKGNEKHAAVAGAFSDHNPFQRAQQQQQQQALAAVAQQMQRHNANAGAAANAKVSNLSPNSKMKMAATEHIELEEPDSAYSDSEDEETIRRRLQHKPWETREGLAQALEAQSTIDADAIFGIPQGGVPLDDILPPQTENARARRMRPRSSSATWSRDGLKQFEIDRFNERMGIKGPGVQLLDVPAASARDEANRSPSRAGRMSALAQSAIAQGHVSSSLHKKTSQAFR